MVSSSLGADARLRDLLQPRREMSQHGRLVGQSQAPEPLAVPVQPMRIGNFVPNRSRYVVYLGRQVATKNIEFLIEAYRRFRAQRAVTSLQLVLAGPTSASRSDDGIVDLFDPTITVL